MVDVSAEYYLKNDRISDPYKENLNDKIWWIHDFDSRGPLLFSFDKEKWFNFWPDYPDNLTPEQKDIFDKENPYLASLKDIKVD